MRISSHVILSCVFIPTIGATVSTALALAHEETGPAFEAAVVKPSASDGGFPVFRMDGGPGTSDPGQLTYRQVPLRKMLMVAYDLEAFRIFGPDWMSDRPYDISAKIPKGTTQADFRLMLQALLSDSFKMALHREKRDVRVYALAVSSRGLKMKVSAHDPNTPPPRASASLDGQGKLHMDSVYRGMPSIVEMASRQLGVPVMDQTGLQGRYDFKLEYDSGGRIPLGPVGIPVQPSETAQNPSGAPDIVRAFEEQLGLHLELRKLPMDVIVVDRAEKQPTR